MAQNWVRIKGKEKKADILVGVYYRPPNQEEQVDLLFFKQEGHQQNLHAGLPKGTLWPI